MVGNTGAPYILKIVPHYFYRWAAGNNQPSIYGTKYSATQSIATTAHGWIAVPSQKAQRGAAHVLSSEIGVGFPQFGALNTYRKPEVMLNPIENCAGDELVPNVNVA